MIPLKKLIVSVFLFLPCFALCFSQEELHLLAPESTQDLPGTETAIVIRANIRKAAVFLNGNYQGLTPITIRGLVPGQYRLSVKKAGCTEEFYLIDVKAALSENFYIELACSRKKTGTPPFD